MHGNEIKGREAVRIRDKHTCQKCGLRWKGGRKLDVHHLHDDYGEKSRECVPTSVMLATGYAITLCHRCHLTLPSEVEKKRNKSSRNPQAVQKKKISLMKRTTCSTSRTY